MTQNGIWSALLHTHYLIEARRGKLRVRIGKRSREKLRKVDKFFVVVVH